VNQKSESRLFYSKGTQVQIDDFALQERPLPAVETAELTSCGSRLVLPFFNLDLGGRGVIGAIGWTACWKCMIEASGDVTSARLRAGMTNNRSQSLWRYSFR